MHTYTHADMLIPTDTLTHTLTQRPNTGVFQTHTYTHAETQYWCVSNPALVIVLSSAVTTACTTKRKEK